MSEPLVTIIGNTTADPELRFTPGGDAVANFTVASTPRIFDKKSNEWKDGETLFLRCSVWRGMAENVAESITKGMRIMISGVLKQRSYEKDGEKRTVIELEVQEIGPSLKYANAKVNRTQRNGSGGQQASGGLAAAWANPPAQAQGGGFGGYNAATTARMSQPAQDDPWAAPTTSNAGGWSNGPDSEPPF